MNQIIKGKARKNNKRDPSPFLYLQNHARIRMVILLVLSDSLSLLIAGFAAVGLRIFISELYKPPFYWSLVPLVIIFLGLYTLQGLYPAVGLSPVEELRRLTISTSAVFLFITAFTFWVRTSENYSRLVFAFAWIFSLLLVPASRLLLRMITIRLGVWGEPVAIIGSGVQAKEVAQFLLDKLQLGIRPVVFIDCSHDNTTVELPLPKYLWGRGTDLDNILHKAGVNTAILISAEMPPELQDAIVDQQYLKFKHLILISNLNWIGSLGITPHDLEGYLGLEIRQNLLDPWEQRVKRLTDLILSLIIGITILPFLLLIALLIKLDSKGSIFYEHLRIGKGGRQIRVLKFRTMVSDSGQVLSEYLAEHPDASKEWEDVYKIKNDPRVTSVGKFLRKYSLDELPQLWNVLKAEMSLVGPRPIVVSEIERYKQGFLLYQRVQPGMTGLWQVSGRTDVSYSDRVRFDEYYVRNWSIWLDIHILVRTIAVVLQRKGAY